jgi:hypothetical protein
MNIHALALVERQLAMPAAIMKEPKPRAMSFCDASAMEKKKTEPYGNATSLAVYHPIFHAKSISKLFHFCHTIWMEWQ